MAPSGQESFDRSRRLTTPAEYNQVFQNARRSGDNLFLVLARDNNLGHARLGMAIARKKIPKATARNRIKRIIRESFRHHQHVLNGLDLVVLARSNLSAIGNQDLFQSLETHWSKHQRLKHKT